MLKNAEMYQVEVALNNGHSLCCNLLSTPTAANLLAVAKSLGDSIDINEALQAFVKEITVPQPGEYATTDLIVAGIVIGRISIVTIHVYIILPKRGRKPKSAATVE
jgi:hypothetical protein